MLAKFKSFDCRAIGVRGLKRPPTSCAFIPELYIYSYVYINLNRFIYMSILYIYGYVIYVLLAPGEIDLLLYIYGKKLLLYIYMLGREP